MEQAPIPSIPPHLLERMQQAPPAWVLTVTTTTVGAVKTRQHHQPGPVPESAPA